MAIDLVCGKITPVELAPQRDLASAKVEHWIKEAKRNIKNGVRAPLRNVREQ